MAFDKTKPAFNTPPYSLEIRNNFVALVEHHRAASAPNNPTEGYIWWDSSDSNNEKLRSYNGTRWLDLFEHMESEPVPATGAGLSYQGTWNAQTNSPQLTSGVGTQGEYYVVSVAGTTNLDGETDWQVGDWAIFNGTVWQKIDNSASVTSVFGRIGAIVAQSNDYTHAQLATIGANDHHAQTHAASHSDGSTDEVTVENLATSGGANTVPKGDGSGGLAMGAVAHLEVSGVSSDQHHAQAHGIASADHSADTLANVNTKINDANVPALAGQLGGTVASPDIRGIRTTTGPALLTIGAIADGQGLKRVGATLVGANTGVLTSQNEDMTCEVTASDGDDATVTVMAATPTGAVRVFVNGDIVSVGNGVKTKFCYFSGDGGTTARAQGAIVSGDKCYWVGTVAGYELDANDRITFVYET